MSYTDLQNKAGATMSALKDGMQRQIERDSQRDAAIFDTAELLKAINMRLDIEREERLAADIAAKRRDRITATIAALTLVATILIGAVSISLQTRQQPPSTPANTTSPSPASSAGGGLDY